MMSAYLSEENRRKIKRIMVHPQFEQHAAEIEERLAREENVTSYHDIALAELEEPFVLGDQILPGCLFEQEQYDFENEFIVTGFGSKLVTNSIPTKFVRKGDKWIDIQFSGDDLQMAKMRQSQMCADQIKDFDKSLIICAHDHRMTTQTGDSGNRSVYSASENCFVLHYKKEENL